MPERFLERRTQESSNPQDAPKDPAQTQEQVVYNVRAEIAKRRGRRTFGLSR